MRKGALSLVVRKKQDKKKFIYAALVSKSLALYLVFK